MSRHFNWNVLTFRDTAAQETDFLCA